MTASTHPAIGTIGWIDLTVDDAQTVRDFYSAVTGWDAHPVEMGGYQEFNMIPPDCGDPVVGICHARGANANLPPTWLVYITVDDIDTSAEVCLQLGGQILAAPKDMGCMGRYCLIQDPGGAIAALFAYRK